MIENLSSSTFEKIAAWFVIVVGLWLTSGTAANIIIFFTDSVFFERLLLRGLGLSALFIGIILIKKRYFILALKASPFIWSLLLLSFISAIWSVEPLQTLRSAVLLSLCFVLGYTMASRLQPVDAWVTIFILLGVLLVAGAILGYIDPDLGTNWGFALKGFFGQKNWYGHAASIYVLIGFGLVCELRLVLQRAMLLVLIVLGIWLLHRSQSVTALFDCLAGISAMLLLYMLRRRVMSARFLISAVATLIGLVWLNSVELLSSFNRTPELTGRFNIWQHLWPIALERPILGYGYDAYLLADGVVDRLGVIKDAVINGGDAHNGFVRIMLDVGFLGVLFGLSFFVHMGLRVKQWLIFEELKVHHYLCLGLWVLALMHQVAEPSLFIPGHYTIALLVFSSITSSCAYQKIAMSDEFGLSSKITLGKST